jgi:hypothetical protein
LLKIKGFSDIKVEKIKEAAKKMAVCFFRPCAGDYGGVSTGKGLDGDW